MAYRNATYIAFDGLSETNPSQSDFKYYVAIQGWDASKHIEFKFANSHERTAAVRDSSSRETLQSRIRERLALSKNCVVILSDQTRKFGSMLSYEIAQAVDQFGLPLICCYVDIDVLLDPRALSHRWPNALTARVDNGAARAIHIPFKRAALHDALGQFTVHGHTLTLPLHYYTREAHASLGLL